ncbi:hypothetical protein [Saccharicrinis aurantiacus]|uniref:hypothetical protein n=1 Tax=Saccharicrinis aurantiacus TaxID=1849719 RepID=UPI000837C166|nr:hypothetical protein [Saccharicrinis aurantiacus]
MGTVFSTKQESQLAFFIIAATFILTFLSDGLSKYAFVQSGGFYRFSLITRALLEMIFIGFIILFFNKYRATLILGIIVLFIIFTASQFFLSLNFQQIDWVTNFIFWNRFIFPLFIGAVFFSLKNDSFFITRLWATVRLILLINNTLIIFGVSRQINFLKTYPDSLWKFGYDGLIFAQNEASYLYIIALLILYYDAVFLKTRRLLFTYTLVSSFFIGTKAVYIFHASLLLFHIIYFISFKKIFLILGIIFSTTYYFLTDNLLVKLQSIWSVFLNNYKNEGLLSALLSGRDNFIHNRVIPLFFEFWQWPNYFIGGHDLINFYTEMGFIDLFLMFGIIGSIIYLSLYSFFVFPYFTRNTYLIFSATITFIIVFTSGHFFESPLNAAYAALFTLYMRNVNTKELKNAK